MSSYSFFQILREIIRQKLPTERVGKVLMRHPRLFG